MRVVFFGTSDFAVPILRALTTAHEVELVVSTPDAKVGRAQVEQASPVARAAAELSLPCEKPEKLKNNETFEQQLQSLNADIFIVVAYGKIIPQSIIDMPPLKMVNVHPSLLPLYRGPAPIQTALRNGESKTGTSIMLIDDQVDHGPLLAQRELDIDPRDTYENLSERLAAVSAELLLDTLKGYAHGTLTPQPQNHEQATFTHMFTKEDGRIDWSKSAEDIYNQFRGLHQWPGIWTTFNGELVKVIDCKIDSSTSAAAPGTVLANGVVACGNQTTLQILQLQPAGKSKMTVADFTNGHHDFIGSILGA